MNPVYELLDFPVAMGRADDVFVRDRNCFGESVELTFAEVLDRSAKFAGVLRLMEVSEGTCVSVASDVSPLTAHLVKLVRGVWARVSHPRTPAPRFGLWPARLQLRVPANAVPTRRFLSL